MITGVVGEFRTVPYAVALELDSDAACRVEAIAARVAAACGDRATTISSVGVPPHLSLAVYDDLPIDGVATALDALAVGTGNTDLLISSIGAFPAAGAASVAFLAPAVTDPLLALHHYCHRALAPLGHACWEQYQPGHWVPHVTVAMGLDREALSTAMACCASGWVPFRARLVALRLIGFPPVMALKQWPLRATAD
jgi:2'-5' RNA ligase